MDKPINKAHKHTYMNNCIILDLINYYIVVIGIYYFQTREFYFTEQLISKHERI